MEYPDNRAKTKNEEPALRASVSQTAKRGAPPRDGFRKPEILEPPVVVEVTPTPPWDAVPDASEFEI